MSSNTDFATDNRIVRTDTPQIEVDSQLMENFRMAGMARLDSQIYPVVQPDGVPWIFSQSEERKVVLTRPSDKHDEVFETSFLKQMDERQDVFFADRFQGKNILVLPRNRVGADERVDIYIYGYTNSSSQDLELKLGTFAKPITVVHLFGREVNGAYYLGLIYSSSSRKDDVKPPYTLHIYTLHSLNDYQLPSTFSQPVDSFHHDFGMSEDGRVGVYSMITPQLFTRDGNGYQGVYRTDGNRARKGDMTVFQAADMNHYYRPGDLAERNKLDYPGGNIKMLTSVENPGSTSKILKPATDFKVAYMDNGTGGSNPFAKSSKHRDGQLFEPTHTNKDYKAIGYVGRGYKNSDVESGGKRPSVDYCMVHKDWLIPGVNFIPKPDSSCQEVPKEGEKREEKCNANMIWRTDSSGKHESITVHQVTNANAQNPLGNLFTVHNGDKENMKDTYIIDTDVTNRESFIFFTDLSESNVSLSGDFKEHEPIVGNEKIYGKDFAIAHREGLLPQPFVLDRSGTIFLVKPKPGEGNRFREIGRGNNHFKSILPAFLADGRLEMYALGEDDELYYARMVSQDRDSWTDFEKVSGRENVQVLDFALSTSTNGNTCYAYGLANALYTVHFEEADQALRFIPINVSTVDKMQSFTSFNIEMNLQTTYGMGMPEQKIEIWSDTRFSAIANGAPFLLNTSPRELYSLADGRLTLTIEAFDITAPMVYLRLPEHMEPDEYITIQPNAHIEQKLKGIDPNDLLNAQKNPMSSEPSPLLKPGNYNDDKLEALSQGINAAFDLIPEEPEANDKYLTKVTALAKMAKSFKVRPIVPNGVIDGRRLREKHWMVDFSNPNPRFVMLSREQAQTEIRTLRELASSNDKSEKKKGHWWNVSWGSAVHSIKNGLKDMGKFIVSVVEGGINVMLEGLKDAVSYIYTGTIGLIQQVFDAVQCFFTSVGAFYKDLVQWLGYLFNWKDIQRTHEAIVYTVQEVLNFLPKPIDRVRLMVDAQFDGMAERIKNAAGQLRGKFDTSLGYESQSATVPESTEGTDKHNVALNGLKANSHKAEMGMEASNEMNGFLEGILELLNRYNAFDAFEEAANKIKAAMTDREQAFSLLLSALVDILEGLAEMTLSIARGVVDGFFDMLETIVELFNKILNQPIRIPLVSDLFKKVSGDDELTILNLLALIVAIPVTPLAKAVLGATPFPLPAEGEPDSLQEYKDSFNLQNLIPSAEKQGKKGPAKKELPEHPAWFYLVVSVGNAAQIPFNAFLDIQPMSVALDGEGTGSEELSESSPLIPKGENATAIVSLVNTIFSLVSVALDVVIQVFKIPFQSLKNFFTLDMDDVAFSKVLGWLLGWVPIAIEIKSLIKDKTIASLADPIKTLLKCVAAFFLIIFRLCQACEGKIDWSDALTKVLWRATKFLAILKLPVVATPNTIGVYTGLHAVGNTIHSVGALVDAYEQQ